jgi:hypothetical protein
MGIEPTPSAWKAEVLPLNYTRNGLDLPDSVYSTSTNANRNVLQPINLPVDTTLTSSASERPLSAIVCGHMVEGGGFEPPKAVPADLQSAPFGHSGTPPKHQAAYSRRQ